MKLRFEILKKANNWFNYNHTNESKIIDQKWLKSVSSQESKNTKKTAEQKLPPGVTIPLSIDKNEAKIRMNIKEFQTSAKSIKKSCRYQNEAKGKITSEQSPVNIK